MLVGLPHDWVFVTAKVLPDTFARVAVLSATRLVANQK